MAKFRPQASSDEGGGYPPIPFRRPGLNRTQRIVAAVGILLLMYFGYLWFGVQQVVGPDEVLVLIKKDGSTSLPGDQIIIPRAPDKTKDVAGYAAWEKQYGDCNGILEQSNKLVDVAKETVAAETNQKVAQAMAEGQKKSAEIDAQRELTVAQVQLEIAQLEAKRTEILGRATAEVERLKNEAEAKGAKMLVDALGSPAAYNRYIFAKNFEPTELRLIFAGPGTFWTDLKTFQEIGASKMIQEGQQPKR